MEQITFCSRKDVIHVDKTNGTSVNYYIFPEYEVHTVLRLILFRNGITMKRSVKRC